MRSRNHVSLARGGVLLLSMIALSGSVTARAGIVRLQSDSLTLEVDDGTAAWKLLDRQSGVSWPSSGTAGLGNAPWLQGRFSRSGSEGGDSIRLTSEKGGAVLFALVDGGRARRASL